MLDQPCLSYLIVFVLQIPCLWEHAFTHSTVEQYSCDSNCLHPSCPASFNFQTRHNDCVSPVWDRLMHAGIQLGLFFREHDLPTNLCSTYCALHSMLCPAILTCPACSACCLCTAQICSAHGHWSLTTVLASAVLPCDCRL